MHQYILNLDNTSFVLIIQFIHTIGSLQTFGVGRLRVLQLHSHFTSINLSTADIYLFIFPLTNLYFQLSVYVWLKMKTDLTLIWIQCVYFKKIWWFSILNNVSWFGIKYSNFFLKCIDFISETFLMYRNQYLYRKQIILA